MSLFRVPLDPNHVLRWILAAARDLIALRMVGALERLGPASIAVERFRSALVPSVSLTAQARWLISPILRVHFGLLEEIRREPKRKPWNVERLLLDGSPCISQAAA
jgi:hypothetical protein